MPVGEGYKFQVIASLAMDAIVELQGLRKVYRRGRSAEPVVAIERLNLQVGTPGTVHGFLGPNGSGKTTTIRCLLGLIRPTEGAVSVFGADATTQFHQVVSRVGAIVESPKMFPNFTGRKNLSLLADLQGIPPTEVDRMLDVVGLLDRGDDTFASYSLGMKQRLAIAGALLKNPDLLILDEPANGLDPAGIAEMRVLIRSIAAAGKAVIVSSHQLSEIEQICDDITIISRGNLVVTGPLQSIRAAHAGRQGVVVSIANRNAAIEALRSAGIVATPLPDAAEIMAEVEPSRAPEITKILAQSGHYLHGMRTQSATLEDIFLELTAPPPPGVNPPAAAMAGAAAPPTAPPPIQPPTIEGGAR